MNRLALALAICAPLILGVVWAPAPAQTQPDADATATPAPREYNDPGMSFKAPEDYYRIVIPPHDPMVFEQPTVVAAWVKNPGKAEQLSITITMENHDGSLEGYEMVTENTLRNQTEGVFFKKREQTKLSNGMPAYWQEVSVGSGFDELKRFSYVWIDGVRGVTLAITGKYGRIDEAVAKQALAEASGVLYPKYRR